MNQGTIRRAPWCAALLLACALGACGRTEEGRHAAAAAPVPQGGAAPELRVGFVYVGPIGDGGWTYAHDQGRRALEAEFGERIATTALENVPEEHAEAAFRKLVQEGHGLIFGTTFGYQDAMVKVAAEFPHVKFEHATGERTAANLAVYEARTYEGAYLAGILAGKASKSGKLGFVASLPIPEVVRNINAFTLGAQSIQPDAVTRVAWVGKWFDPVRERAAALSLIDGGADVLIQNTDSAEVLKAAQERGVHGFGWDSDMTAYGQKAHLGSAAIDWAPYYRKAVQEALDGRWQPGRAWWGVRQNVIRLASPSPALPRADLLHLGERIAAIRAGKLLPFQGPLVDQDGRELLPAGKVLGDAELKSMRFLVRGVEGKLPAS